MEIRNPIFNVFGTIDCEINHPSYGWIPFTADPNDVEQSGRDIHATALLMGTAPYQPPPPPTPEEEAAALAAERAAMRLTFAQLLIGLVTEAWITQAEGEAWLAGTLPLAVTNLIATLPTNEQFIAKAHALRPSEVVRLDPLVASMGAAQGKTMEEIDTFFRTYRNV